jgi:hypothetical protein
MTTLNISRTRERLQGFEFKTLFIEELGWSRPKAGDAPLVETIDGIPFTAQPIAHLAGVVVYEVSTATGAVPDARIRARLHTLIERRSFEHLLVFVDAARTQTVWSWVKRDAGGKRRVRSHYYFKQQPGDLFLSKLSGMVFDLGAFEQGDPTVTEVANRLQRALDVEQVTKRFYSAFNDLRETFTVAIKGIPNEREQRWYASVLLNRILFIYFLQRKFILDGGNERYLQDKLEAVRRDAKLRVSAPISKDGEAFYSVFLKTLFFEGFALPEDKRNPDVKQLIGEIKYLNGGLFLPHAVEEKYGDAIHIADDAFDGLFALLEKYSWNLNDTPGGDDNEINPHVLGYIFEKYINQKEFGAYYTRPEITEYLCEQTIHRLILDGVNARRAEAARERRLLEEAGMAPTPSPSPARVGGEEETFETLEDLLRNLDAGLCRALLLDGGILPSLKLFDPACGSGAFLVAAMKTLIEVYSAVIGQAERLDDPTLREWLREVQRHPSVDYFIKRRIITDNLFGVDIMDEAVEIARLRLFLALVASVEHAGQLEPLPNIDFNILPGNSLIGLLRVDEAAFNEHQAEARQVGTGLVGEQLALGLPAGGKSYAQVVAEKNRLIQSYRSNAQYGEHLQDLRDGIEARRKEDVAVLNALLLDQFQALGIQVQQATWDEKKGEEGRPTRRALKLRDIEQLAPFHWGYEFDEVMNARPSALRQAQGSGGFDAIITNPPWEIFKPQAKEFFAEYSEVVTKNAMTIKDFEKEQSLLLKQPAVRRAWLDYLSRFPHVSAWYRSAPQFANQIAVVNGKKAGSDINLYKLFVEQCHNLLRAGGLCGIVIPSGIYTDLGAKQLREMLFDRAEVDALLSLSNERFLFENVHHAFKFALLTFKKGNATNTFRAAFRINTREAIGAEQLDAFLNSWDDKINISVDLVRRLSPDSLSVMEFKSDTDVRIAEKMLRFPLLGEQIEGVWSLRLTREFDMTNDSHLFKTQPAKGRLPLYEGKMIHQFDANFAEPRYWVDEREGRKALLGNQPDAGQVLDYQRYRLGFRAVAASTNEHSLIAAMLPSKVFSGNSVITAQEWIFDDYIQLFVLACLNGFVVDWMLRQKVTTNINMFYIYQLPVPRITNNRTLLNWVVSLAAQLICTTPAFDDLRKSVENALGVAITPATGEAERARLRAELDGMVAHLYGLSEAEFAHVLGTFPLVAQAVKDAALAAYRTLCNDADFQAAVAEAVASQDALRKRADAGSMPPAVSKDNIADQPAVLPVPATVAKPARKPRPAPAADPEPLFRPSIDAFDKDDLLAAVRDAFDAGNPLGRDEVIRNAARALGYERAGARISEALDNAIATAVRRGLVENEGDALRLFRGGLADWDRDFAKEQFLAAIGRGWVAREEAVKRFSRWLGYRRAGPAFDEAARSLINGLIREGRLEAMGNEIRRV